MFLTVKNATLSLLGVETKEKTRYQREFPKTPEYVETAPMGMIYDMGKGRTIRTMARKACMVDQIIFPSLPVENPYYRSILAAIHEDVYNSLDKRGMIDVCVFSHARDKLQMKGTGQTEEVLDFLRLFHCKGFEQMDPSLHRYIPDMYSFIFTEGRTVNPLAGMTGHF